MLVVSDWFAFSFFFSFFFFQNGEAGGWLRGRTVTGQVYSRGSGIFVGHCWRLRIKLIRSFCSGILVSMLLPCSLDELWVGYVAQ